MSLPSLAVAMMAALVLWPGGAPPPNDQRLRVLAETASAFTPQITRLVRDNGSDNEVNDLVSSISDRTNARVTLMSVRDGIEGLQVVIFVDSYTDNRITDLQFDVANVAARTARTALGSETTREGKLGQVAVPIRDEGTVSRVAVFSVPMGEIKGRR